MHIHAHAGLDCINFRFYSVVTVILPNNSVYLLTSRSPCVSQHIASSSLSVCAPPNQRAPFTSLLSHFSLHTHTPISSWLLGFWEKEKKKRKKEKIEKNKRDTQKTTGHVYWENKLTL